MTVPYLRKGVASLGLLFILFIVLPAYALIIPPDPFDSTERYALLIPAPDGTIIKVTAKVKTPGDIPFGAGELRALIRYKIIPSPGGKAFHFVASKAVSIQDLSNNTSTIIDFDFSEEPLPRGAYYRSLHIYYQGIPDAEPRLIAEYRPEQLLLRPPGDTVVTFLIPGTTAQGDQRILGPITILREREDPKTELISFTVSDATGPFLLNITNGTSDGGHRVSSAVVKINGLEVFRPSDFSQKVAGLSRQVTLLSGDNLLEVRLRSAPGAHITLELFRLSATTCRAFGPYTFIRTTGKPKKENVSFTLNPQIIGPYTMTIRSGNPDGSNRVDSAAITLNGQVIFGSSDFNEQMGELSRVISLQSSNTLGVELNGAPGDLLTIEITGYDNTSPQVTVTSPSSGATVDTGQITVNGTVDDSYSSVTVNGIRANVLPDGTFVAEGITLIEGENTIRVVATDACGNKGEDQITIYYRIVPPGPQITLCAEPFREQTPEIPPVCNQQAYGRYYGLVVGYTEETPVSVTLNGILLPDGVEVYQQGDIFSGMREGNFFWAFVNIPRVDGIHPYTAVIIFADGRQSEATVTFVRDTVPPRLTVTSPADRTITNNRTITVTGTVDDPEATVLVNWRPVPVVDGTFTAQVDLGLGDGTRYLNIQARDPSSNSSWVYLRIIVDTTPPVINVTNPAEGMAVNMPTFDVAGTITDQNIGTITVVVNNGQPQPLTIIGSGFSGTVTLTALQNTFTFVSTDLAGNTSTLSRIVVLDQAPPIVTIISPMSGSEVSGIVTVMIEANDTESGIGNVTLLVDGQAIQTLLQPPFNFQTNTLLLVAGLHTITVRAIDKAGNQAEASIQIVVLDQTSPQVVITSPLPGSEISGKVTVTVETTDAQSGIGSVTLLVDGEVIQTLLQAPFNCQLNTLTLTAGLHTITVRAIDGAGNQVETSIQIVVLDQTPPLLAITSPLPGSEVAGKITVSVEATDIQSGIGSVTLFVDDQAIQTLLQLPFNFQIDTMLLVAGLHTIAARAIDGAGNQGETSIPISALVQLGIEITSPVPGATINKTTTIIKGETYQNADIEIGVTVNGVLAHVQGNIFAAIVPLQQGQNTITAVATNIYGIKAQTTITINTDILQEQIRLLAIPSSSILSPITGTLDVILEAEAYLDNPVSNYSWDLDGDGTGDITGVDSKVTAQYQAPGLYYSTVTIIDTQGNTYTETTIVNVLSREEMDALLKGKWEGMKGALISGNIEGALRYIATLSQNVYRYNFELMSSILPIIAQDMGSIIMVKVIDDVAEYEMIVTQNGQTLSFYVEFVRDEDGIWRIRFY